MSLLELYFWDAYFLWMGASLLTIHERPVPGPLLSLPYYRKGTKEGLKTGKYLGYVPAGPGLFSLN